MMNSEDVVESFQTAAGIKLTILATDQLIAKMPKIRQLAENII